MLKETGVYKQLPGSNPLASQPCHLTGISLADPIGAPDPTQSAFYLVDGFTGLWQSGLGSNSAGIPRPYTTVCPKPSGL